MSLGGFHARSALERRPSIDLHGYDWIEVKFGDQRIVIERELRAGRIVLRCRDEAGLVVRPIANNAIEVALSTDHLPITETE